MMSSNLIWSSETFLHELLDQVTFLFLSKKSRVTAPPFQAPTRLEVLAPLRSLERQIKLELSSTFSQREKGCFTDSVTTSEEEYKDILRHSCEMVCCNGVITETHFRFLSQLYYSGLDYKH